MKEVLKFQLILRDIDLNLNIFSAKIDQFIKKILQTEESWNSPRVRRATYCYF